jgi:NADH-quinone oxidoreductase subunit F
MPGVLPDEPLATLADYIAAGGGGGLAAAMRDEPARVVDEVAASGLRGRGGAGFPTGTKWRSVIEASGDAQPRIVCNAAEGEPGTYKDRALLARNPYQVLEGLLIAAYAVGAPGAVLATKRQYTHEVERLATARGEMRDAGWLGADRLEIALGPDEYLFGEESALLEVIEGKLPMPRILPPYMYGLHATMQSPNPTVVNNVETLAHVATIVRDGADAFRAQGTQEAPGTMVFTLIGDVANPGVYELPLGTSLRTLVEDIGGASDVKALYSGSSNAVIPAGLLDLPMDFDSFTEAGTGLGSGGFIVYDTSRCMVQAAATLSRFLAVESCAQCPPCKLHGVEIHERLDALCRGEGSRADLGEIERRCGLVTDANRCYLPVGHALVVRSALEAFADEFERAAAQGCDHDDELPMPKIIGIDDDTGEVRLDADYSRKQLDWSYADAASDPV